MKDNFINEIISTISEKIFLLKRGLNFYLNFVYLNKKSFFSNKLHYKSKPVIIQKTYITGKGNVYLGHKCKFGFKLGGFYRNGSIELQSRTISANIYFGDYVATNNNLFICSSNLIKIGDKTRIGQGVFITDFEAHAIDPAKRSDIGEIGSVIIGRNVWIGNNVTILKNSKIGDNSIIAAGAVVNGNFPKNSVIGGVPAKTIKKI